MYSSVRLLSPAPAWRLNLSSCVSEYNYIRCNVSLNNYTTCLRMPLRQSVKEKKQKTGKICDIRNKTQTKETRWNRHRGVGAKWGARAGGIITGPSSTIRLRPVSVATEAAPVRPAQLLDTIYHPKANPGPHSSWTPSTMPRQTPANPQHSSWTPSAMPRQTPVSTALEHHLPSQGKPRPAQLLDIICHAKANPGQHNTSSCKPRPAQLSSAMPAQLLDTNAKANPGQHSSWSSSAMPNGGRLSQGSWPSGSPTGGQHGGKAVFEWLSPGGSLSELLRVKTSNFA